MIDQLIAALNQEVDLSAEEIADTLWLAMHMEQYDVDSTSRKSQKSRPNPETTEDNSKQHSQPDLVDKSQTETSSTEQESTEKQQEDNRTGIYNQQSNQTQKSLDIPFKVPDAPSLREQLDLARALRPLMRRIPSGSTLVLDEAATTQRIADEGIWLPVIKPTLEPWLDLELVVDEGISIQIWRHTIKELERLLKNYGIFRDVRVWGLISNEQNKIQIRRGIGATAKNQSPRSTAELIDSSGRRLVLVVSDCVSDLWRIGAVNLALQTWANNVPTAIIQMLPQWLWGRTALRRATEVRFQGLDISTSNRQLIANTVSLWSEIDEAKGIKVPVFTLEPERVSKWAQMLVGKGSIQASGFVFKPEIRNLEQEKSLFNLDRGELTPEQRVQAFRVTASPMARKLAGLLASAPVISLPVVRLIRETMLKDSQQVHVAEVFLGGLLKPLSEIEIDTEPDYVQYGFIDGVRELLVDSVPTSSVLNVVEEVSKFIAKKVGLSLEEFVATLKNPQEVRNSKLSGEILPFAMVTAQVLKRLGGKYLKFSEQLQKSKKYWIFQCNPKNYRLKDAIKDLKEMPWPVKRHKDDIAMGDGAITWISGKKAGIYAFGEISKPVKIFEKVADIDYWINKDIQNDLRTRPGPCIRFTNKLLDKPILKEQLKQDSLLKTLKVILYPYQGSVFEATSEQWKRIQELRKLDIQLPLVAVEELADKEIDYTKLHNLLATRRWKEADEETANIMLKFTNRVNNKCLRLEDIKKLPSNILNQIDQLWLDYSNNNFGFSVQKEIYTSLQSNQEYNKESWNLLGKKVGWKDQQTDTWLYYSKLNFDITAPRGHLPALAIWSKNRFHRGQRGVAFISRPDLPITIPPKIQKDTILTLLAFEFITVTLNAKTEIIKTETKQTQYFTENLDSNVILEMVAIPSGTFIMGSSDSKHSNREKPSHRVKIQHFFMGKYPVTQEQWRVVAHLPKVKQDLNPDPSHFKGHNRPVENVSWYDAVEFCDRLSKYTGREYRLPSEAEWEYACRAGTTTPFHFGETLTPDLAIYGSNRNSWERIKYSSKNPTSRPKPANQFGLFDMHGTVWEWCADSWHVNYENAPNDGNAWIDKDKKSNSFKTQFVVRGGSWGKPLESCSSSYRQSETSNYKSEYNGFRLVCNSENKEPRNYQEDNLEILINKVIPFHQEVIFNAINQNLESSLVDQTVDSYYFSDDSNEATIEWVAETNDIEIEIGSTNTGLLSINFSLKAECGLSYFILKADYYAIADDKENQISVSELNDHYFTAEETYNLKVKGVISVDGDSETLVSSLLSNDELLEFLQDIDIFIDSITTIEVDS